MARFKFISQNPTNQKLFLLSKCEVSTLQLQSSEILCRVLQRRRNDECNRPECGAVSETDVVPSIPTNTFVDIDREGEPLHNGNGAVLRNDPKLLTGQDDQDQVRCYLSLHTRVCFEGVMSHEIGLFITHKNEYQYQSTTAFSVC